VLEPWRNEITFIKYECNQDRLFVTITKNSDQSTSDNIPQLARTYAIKWKISHCNGQVLSKTTRH
jgi:hypothetical protein